MTTWKILWTGVLAAVVVLAPDDAAAETSNCDSRIGACEVSNDFDDAFSCECANGSSGFGGGGNEWSGLSQAELDAVCLETLDVMCGEAMPPEGIPCDTREGSCVVDNEPDAVSCDCADGSGGFGGGGNDWDGLSDDELFDVCLEQVQFYCGPFEPPQWDCENDYGSCDLEVDGDPTYFCGCSNGGGGGGPGEPGWADLDEDELELVCFETISEVCGGPPPTSTSESESDTGATDVGTEEGATDDAPTSDDATDDASDDANDDTTTGDPDPTDDDASASASASATMTAGDTDTDGDDETGDDAGASGSDDASGCSCNADGRARQGLFGLALFALLGLRARRRRR